MIAQAQHPVAHMWPLGRGYTALVSVAPKRADKPFPRWTFEVTHDGRVVLRHREYTEWMTVAEHRDITGDGVDDVLLHTIGSGTAGEGVWRVYGGTEIHELWLQRGDVDSKRVQLRAGSVQTWHAIFSSQTKATRGGIHCCWRLWWHTTWRWTGSGFVRGRPVVTDRPPQR